MDREDNTRGRDDRKNPHQQNEETEAGKKKEDVPNELDTTRKKEGVTSSFSRATTGDKYSGEDVEINLKDTGGDEDKYRAGQKGDADDKNKIGNK